MRKQPKVTKYRKSFKGGSRKGYSSSNNKVLNRSVHGTYSLMSIETARLSLRQLESSRRTIRHHIERDGKLWINVFPFIPVTSKPLEVRIGGGKGSVDYWACYVRKGTVMFERSGITYGTAKKVMNSVSKKRPIRTKFISSVRELPTRTWL